MVKLIAHRVMDSLPTLFILTVLAFLLTHFIPGSPAAAILGQQATPAAIAALEHDLGLDEPLLEQFTDWFGGVVTGDFGTSISSGRPVMDMIAPRVLPTVSLTLGATIVALLIGITAGVLSALRPGSLLDRGLAVVTAFGLAIPAFWLGLILLQIFAVRLGILPVIGWRPPDRGLGQWALGMLLPVVTLGLGCSAIIARQTRTAMIEALEAPFIKTLRAVGTRTRTVVRYALKNAMIPILTVTGFQIVTIVAIGFIVERVFTLPGLGTLLVQSVSDRDIPLIQALTILVGVTVMLVYLLIDVAIVFLNPKVRTH